MLEPLVGAGLANKTDVQYTEKGHGVAGIDMVTTQNQGVFGVAKS